MTANAPKQGGWSPWGEIQSIEECGSEVCFVSTAGHGGYWVPPRLRHHIPKHQRTEAASWVDHLRGWFEEDCCAAYVVAALPMVFTEKQRVQAICYVEEMAKRKASRGEA